jgi:hypothetical protein
MSKPELTETECIEQLAPVAEVLIKIRDRKLYLRNYATFEDYVKGRWGERILKLLAEWEEARGERN